MSTVVGIAQNQHDSCLSVVQDGVPKVHVELERVLRKKRATFSSAQQAVSLLAWTLRHHEIREVDAIAVVRHMVEPENKKMLQLLHAAHPKAELMWFEHLDCHAALAAASGAEESVSIALDGGGDRRVRTGAANGVVETWLNGRPVEGRILTTGELSIDGRAWSVLSHALFRDEHAAGKVMGMAAFGRDEDRARDAIDRMIDRALLWRYDDDGLKTLSNEVEAETFQHGANMAFALQTRFTEAMVEFVGVVTPPGARVVLTGGCALNVVTNSAIALLPEARGGVWVPPCPGDKGISLGAALRGAAALGDRIAPLGSPFLVSRVVSS
ncbi:carbamoyltransferase N-terminal domain-containing protein [Microbacterium lacticum]